MPQDKGHDDMYPRVVALPVQPPDNSPDKNVSYLSVNANPVQPIDNSQEDSFTIPEIELSGIKSNVEDDARKQKILPLTGKLVTSEDPVVIGPNFKTYKNLRPTATHPKAIGGMGKVNLSNAMDATYLKTRSAYHLVKSQPAESHVLVQAYNAGLTLSQVLDNTTAIGSTGDFAATELFTDTGAVEYGMWSEATEGQVVYSNGTDTCIWGGNELRCAGFITSSATVTDTGTITNPKDFTNMVTNTIQDGANSVNIGGDNDTYTVLLLHGDGTVGSTTITDTSVGGANSPKTLVAAGGAQLDTLQKKFGTTSIKVDAAGDYVYVDSTDADINDFCMGTGKLTIDFWAYRGIPGFAESGDIGFFRQWKDADNYVSLIYIQSIHALYFEIVSTTQKVSLLTASLGLSAFEHWTHVALIRGFYGGANTWAIAFHDNVNPDSYTTLSNSETWPDLDADFDIGQGYYSAADIHSHAWIDEFRVSKGIARWTAAFSPPARAYSDTSGGSKYFLIGSLRPLKGVKFYIPVGSGNATASTLTGKCWNGSTWVTLTLTDNTDTGATLAVTGTVTFDSTVSWARPRYYEGMLLYWYQFSIDSGSSTIYYVTLDAPFQKIVDAWDGVERDIGLCYLYKAGYIDYTINVYESSYDSATVETYLKMVSLAAGTEYVLVGFIEQATAINVLVAPDFVNAEDASITVSYWNGESWVSIGNINDGTSENSHSLAKPGIISWNPVTPEVEFKKSISNGIPLYYYKLEWSVPLSADVRIYYIASIPTQKTIGNYRFPIYTQNRLLLCSNVNQKKNVALYSGMDSSQIFNGDDSGEIEFGDETPLTCGCSLFTQFGSNLYSLSLIYKDSEIWALTYIEDKWIRYKISESIGCSAPLTLRTIIVQPNENIQNTNRYIAVWQAHNGIYISDGRFPTCISKDIEDRFDRSSSTCINNAYLRKSYGFIDELNQEYHWLYCNGTPGDVTSPLNKEMVFSFKEWKWYEIDRTTGKYLQAGVSVRDTYGNPLTYGFIDTGYMEALEWLNATTGTIKTLDGIDITCTLETGDFALKEGEFFIETRVIGTMLMQLAKTTTVNNATLTHYVDTSTINTTSTFDPTKANYRVSFPYKAESSTPGVLHSFKLVMIANDETIAFEPLALNIRYVEVRDYDYDRNW